MDDNEGVTGDVTENPADVTQTPTDTEPQNDQQDVSDTPKQSRGVQKRLDELTAQRRAAERRADALQADLSRAIAMLNEGLQAKTATPPADKPKRGDFDSPDDYDDALASWSAEKARQDERQKIEQQQRAENARKAAEAWEERKEKAIKEHPDFAELVGDKNLRITPYMAAHIQTSPNGTTVAYYLGKNPDEAEDIAELEPAFQAYEMRKLERRLMRDSAREPVKTKLPAPINPVKSKGGSVAKTINDADLSMEEYAALRNPAVQKWKAPVGVKT